MKFDRGLPVELHVHNSAHILTHKHILGTIVSEWDARASRSGPTSDKVGVRVTVRHVARDSFTLNDVTGNDLETILERDISNPVYEVL